MARVTFKPICIVYTANDSGEANISIKIPGTFSGVTDDKSGRFLKYLDVWTDTGTIGDRITGLRLEDTDLILQGLGLSANFPDYPVIHYFQDQDMVETDNIKRGLFLTDRRIRLEKIDEREPFEFIPSGFYLKASYLNGALLGGQKIRVNVGWGKNT